MARAKTATIRVLIDPPMLRKAESAARKAEMSLSSWTLRLITQELGVPWEPPARGRPPGAKNKRKKRKKKKKDENV
jgi:hypothetical protein